MKQSLLVVAVLVALATAAPVPSGMLSVQRRDGTTEFDPDYGFKRDGTTEFDPDYGFRKRDGTAEFDPDYGFKRDGTTEFDPDYAFKRDETV
ncbi:hypothetical protein BO71DRAFT_394763 [Aspergillus ellipticus CBS 707.79]|uniref:Uncharacterized protein n=1 Tax=Aspergillus ellipticus CBS 707.79 TaxID=1448320 RepID=A0A319DN07_9EURO|nr:hypothetical protein BO71DRAFT_394763 [Aspergillus ellipticus CBS 707.79]